MYLFLNQIKIGKCTSTDSFSKRNELRFSDLRQACLGTANRYVVETLFNQLGFLGLICIISHYDMGE